MHQSASICQAHPVEELTIEDFFQDRCVDSFTAPRTGPTVDLFTKIVERQGGSGWQMVADGGRADGGPMVLHQIWVASGKFLHASGNLLHASGNLFLAYIIENCLL